MTTERRRDQLAAAAARRFHEIGYHGVSLADVAADAGLTGPGVYRHFRNKEALLVGAISTGLARVEAAVAAGTGASLADLVAAMAEVALARPDMWVLLQRESRFLSSEARAGVLARFGQSLDAVATRLRAERRLAGADARLLATAATAVLAWPSTTRTSLEPTAVRSELTAAALRCLRADLGRTRPAAAVAADAGARSRREQIIDASIDLFFHHGYAGVSLDGIGAAIGIAGPSVLHHFPTKSDILVTAFDQAAARLATVQARRRSDRQARGLVAVVDSYIAFCLANRSLLGVYVSEPAHLPADAHTRTLATVRREVRDWTRSLLAEDLDLGEPLARLRVQAALVVVNDLVRLGHLAERPRIRAEVGAIALAVLAPWPSRD